MNIEFFYSVELKSYTFLFKKKDNIQNKPEEFTEYFFPIMALQNYLDYYLQLRLIRLHCIKCHKRGIIRSLRIFNFYTSHWI